MKILLLNYKIPLRAMDGGEYAQLNFASSISRQPDTEVHILALNSNYPKEKTIETPKELARIKSFSMARVKTKPTYLGAIKGIFGKQSYLINRFYSKEFNLKLINLLKTQQFDIIHLEHLYLGLYLDTIRKYHSGKIVLRTQNIEHELWETNIRTIKNPLKRSYLKLMTNRLKKFETKVFRQMNGVISLTEKDRFSVLEADPIQRTACIPIGIHLRTKSELDFDNKEQIRFYFLGSLDWLPNQFGLKWFIKEVLPKALKLFPHAEFHFAGKNASEDLLKLRFERTFIYNNVPDASQFIDDKDVLIAPVFTGGGLKIKILEALNHGKPVICTPFSAIGFEKVKEHLHFANTSKEFLHQMAKFVNSFKDEYSKSMNGIIEKLRYFDNDNQGKMTISFYKSLIN